MYIYMYVYNNIPDIITDTQSMYSFKTNLKQYLVEQTFYSYYEFMAIITIPIVILLLLLFWCDDYY